MSHLCPALRSSPAVRAHPCLTPAPTQGVQAPSTQQASALNSKACLLYLGMLLCSRPAHSSTVRTPQEACPLVPIWRMTSSRKPDTCPCTLPIQLVSLGTLTTDCTSKNCTGILQQQACMPHLSQVYRQMGGLHRVMILVMRSMRLVISHRSSSTCTAAMSSQACQPGSSSSCHSRQTLLGCSTRLSRSALQQQATPMPRPQTCHCMQGSRPSRLIKGHTTT